MEKTVTVSTEYTNNVTGEVLELSHEAPVKNKRPGAGKESAYSMCWGGELAKIRLAPRTWQVYWSLTTVINLETGICWYSSNAIAGELGMKPTAVSRAVRELMTARMAIRVGRGQLRLNPRLTWRGPLEARRALLLTIRTQALDVVSPE